MKKTPAVADRCSFGRTKNLANVRTWVWVVRTSLVRCVGFLGSFAGPDGRSPVLNEREEGRERMRERRERIGGKRKNERVRERRVYMIIIVTITQTTTTPPPQTTTQTTTQL